jgi:TolB-like protein
MIGLAISLVLGAPAPAPSAEPPPTLLVAPLRAVGIEKLVAEIFSEEIRVFVGKSRNYTLVTPEEMAAVDAELARQLSEGCDDTQCISELGGALGAKLIITGKIGRVENRISLNLKLVDIATVTAIKVAGRRAARLTDLQDQLGHLVRELLGDAQASSGQKREKRRESLPLLKRVAINAGATAALITGFIMGQENADAERSMQTAVIADAMILSGIAAWIWSTMQPM